MVDDLTCIFPRQIHESLRWLGKIDWLRVETAVSLFALDRRPRTMLTADIAAIESTPGHESEAGFCALHMIREFSNERGEGTLHLGYLEAGGVTIVNGPKLFSPTEEQFDSMGHVDLHIPIGDFRSPFPSLIVRIPNEWRKAKCAELGINVQRAPQHVLVRCGKTVDDKIFIITIQRYANHEHYQMISDNPDHVDLESVIRTQVHSDSTVVPELHMGEEAGEIRYCIAANRAALNICLMMTHFGCRVTGPLDPHRYAINRKKGSQLRHGDFQAVEMSQNVIIRKTQVLDGLPGTIGEDDPNRPQLWEVKPHWRRGHWRRKPGWAYYVEKGEVPPRVFVRPTLVRRDRIVGDVGQSQATYSQR